MPYNNASDPELISQSAAVVDAYTPEMHAHLISLFATPETLSELHNRLQSGYAAYLNGDPEGVRAFEQDRDAVKLILTMLHGLGKVATIKDPTVLDKLRLPRIAVKSNVFTGDLTEPHGFKVVFDRKGQMVGTVVRVSGAKGYQIWACEGDPNIEANWKLVASAPTCRGILIPGLNRAKNNWLKIRAMRGNGAGPWSNIVTLTPA
jgi:hypothetical protein